MKPLDTFRRYAHRDTHFPRNDAEGNRVCRWCRKPISKGVYCCEAHKIEVDVRCGMMVDYYVRQRDHGICADCGIDTQALDYALDELRWTLKESGSWGYHYAATNSLFYEITRACGLVLEIKTTEAIHHVVAVEDGGGCCGLDNLITLCIRCHKKRHGANEAKAAGRGEGTE